MSSNKELVTTTASAGTSAEWTAENPVLELGEWGKETDTSKMKNGDGVTAWNSLGYTVVVDPLTGSSAQLCKAWVNFNGDTGLIRDSYNVSSITKNGTGDYTINFTTAMANANYSPVITTFPNASNTSGQSGWIKESPTYGDSIKTGSLSVQTGNPGGLGSFNSSKVDCKGVFVQIFGV